MKEGEGKKERVQYNKLDEKLVVSSSKLSFL
jgi:hypothetical protein